MEQVETTRLDIRLMGITARTNNKTELAQIEPKIGPLVMKYFHENFASKITNRSKPGTTYCVFTDYESNHTGDYTYFIGEEVGEFDTIPEGFETLAIPEGKYVKFTNGPAPMPGVCIDIWKKIWSDEELESKRAYISDFEIYDERALDHNNVVLDIYIGVK